MLENIADGKKNKIKKANCQQNCDLLPVFMSFIRVYPFHSLFMYS